MGLPGPERPRVSRETRLLFATILLSIAALWALARLRFPDRTVATSPVPPLLTQLTAPPAFDDLAAEIAKLEPRLLPSLVQTGSGTALRVRRSAGAIYLGLNDTEARSIGAPQVLSRDGASGLAIVAVPDGPVATLMPWSPNQLDRSRYVIGTGVSGGGVFLRPVFVGHLYPLADLAWRNNIWMLPARTDVSPGDFLFTTDGALVGLVVPHPRALAVVPGETLLGAVDTVLARPGSPGGWVGVEVDAFPAPAAPDSEADQGIVVAWVDPEGPAAEKLFVMDVIQAIDDGPVASPADWRVRLARLAPGASIVLRVRRGTEIREVALVTEAPPSRNLTLGLKMRTVRRIGAEVLAVVDASAAARAGIRDGDVITAVDNIRAPTAQQVERAFEGSAAGRFLLVAIARGNRHHIVALKKE